jgi:hypothetical protein
MLRLARARSAHLRRPSSAKDGRYKWLNPRITVSCIIAQGKAFAGATDSYIYALEIETAASGTVEPVSPPKPRISLSADGSVGADVSVTIPSGDVVTVSLDGSGSTPDDPALPIASYSWSADGSVIGSGVEASYTAGSNTSFSLTVTDVAGQSASASGSLNISFDCEDPAADIISRRATAPIPRLQLARTPRQTTTGSPGTVLTRRRRRQFAVIPPRTITEGPAIVPILTRQTRVTTRHLTTHVPTRSCTIPIATTGVMACWQSRMARFGHTPPGLHVLGVKRKLANADPTAYYVVLVDGWKDASTLSMVGRFPHQHGYVDAVYLPSANPSAQGFTLAVRALQLDRAKKAPGPAKRRVIRIGVDGSQQFTRVDGHKVAPEQLALVSQPALGKIESDFTSGLIPKILRVPKHASKNMVAIRMMKWPRQ